MNGSPVEGALVSFSPKSTESNVRSASGTTDADGEYSLMTYEAGDGAIAGEYVVLITKYASVTPSAAPQHSAHGSGGGPPQHSSKATAPKSELPEKYSRPNESPFTVKVPADDPEAYNFDLKP